MGASLAVFLACLVGVVGSVGLAASRRSRGTERDYFLAGQDVHPALLALSHSASKYSGFIFAGFMGAAFSTGTAVVWFGLGILAGAFVVALLAVPRLQAMNAGGRALSLAELVTVRGGEDRVLLRRLMGAATVLFLAIYAAAQLKAGGKVLEAATGGPPWGGVLLGAAVILFYCWAGGIRASVWTDAAQAALMVLGLAAVLAAAAWAHGGPAGLLGAFLDTAPPGSDETALFPRGLSVGGGAGLGLHFLGALGFGVATLGQPHILARSMVLRDAGRARTFVAVNLAFETAFAVLFVLAGLATRVVLRDAPPFDPELALFLSATALLHPAAVGLVLASVFSSTVSTADSQLIACSASLSRELPGRPRGSLPLAKAGTVGVTLLAVLVALFGGGDVFSLVVFAFSGLGASIGSVVALALLGWRVSEGGAVLTACSGAAAVVLWRASGLHVLVGESVPGFLAAFLAYALWRLLAARPAGGRPAGGRPAGGRAA